MSVVILLALAYKFDLHGKTWEKARNAYKAVKTKLFDETPVKTEPQDNQNQENQNQEQGEIPADQLQFEIKRLEEANVNLKKDAEDKFNQSKILA